MIYNCVRMEQICWTLFYYNMINCAHKYSTLYVDHLSSQVYICNDCGVAFTRKALNNPEPKLLYKDFYKDRASARFYAGIEYIIRLFRFLRAFKIKAIDRKAKSILDIGSGRGFMLYYLKKYFGFNRTAGSQISKHAYEFSRGRLGLEIYDKDIIAMDFGGFKFNIVSMWHVLEHLPQPEDYIKYTYDILREKGFLIIEVPNFSSWTRRLTGKYWLGLDLKHHITHFNPVTLSNLLASSGFRIKKVSTFSLEFSTFVSAQSLISQLTGTDHILFEFLQKGCFSFRILLHIVMFTIIAPICLAINLLLYFSKQGEILRIVAQKNV